MPPLENSYVCSEHFSKDSSEEDPHAEITCVTQVQTEIGRGCCGTEFHPRTSSCRVKLSTDIKVIKKLPFVVHLLHLE